MTAPVKQATSLFQDRFGSRPAVLASAPGRVNLLGEHTDYNGGPVLPLAIERRTAVALGPGTGWEFATTTEAGARRVDPAHPDQGHWTAYPAAVLRVLAREGITLPGGRLAVASSVPVGAGLSSSAALLVAVTRAVLSLARRRKTAAEVADIAWRAEHDEVGVRCGRMDQTASARARPGHALLFETATMEVTHVPLAGKVWVVDTGVTHRLADGDYNARRRECENALALVREQGRQVERLAELGVEELPALERAIPAPFRDRLRHVVTECARTRRAARALAAQDLPALGRLLVEGHRSLQQHFQSTVPEADLLVDRLVEHGAFGARLTGAGFGGAVIALLPAGRETHILAAAQEAFQAVYGRVPPVWSTRAAPGARTERVPA